MGQSGDIYGEYDDAGNFYPYSIYGGGGSGESGGWDWWGGAGSNGGNAGYTPWDWWGGNGEEKPYYPTGGAVPPGGSAGTPTFRTDGSTSGDSSNGNGPTFSPQIPPGGKGRNIYLPMDPFTPTGAQETGAGQPNRGTSNNVTNNSQTNNTQNNSNVLAQSVGLGAFSPISSGVPTAAASSFKPNVISSGGGLHEGAPPPMPAPHAPEPPTLHPEKPTDWSKITFGAASSAPQSNPAGQRSTLGKIGGAIGQITGLGQVAQRYKGLYDSMHPQKPKTPEEEQAEAYRATYGL